MEFRQLEAFVAVAVELHFGRAAQKLHIGQPTLSDLVRRLEREVGTPLFERTTRRVALTDAGTELFGRAQSILESVDGAVAAVRRIADGAAGTVRLGMTPPVGPVLAPSLAAALAAELPAVDLVVRRMWLPALDAAIAGGDVDVAITCGIGATPRGLTSRVFCAEPLVVSVRANHPLAEKDSIALADLVDDTLGLHSEALFPAWSIALRQVLHRAGLNPPTVELADPDLSASRWATQPAVDWLLTTTAISGRESDPAPAAPATRLIPLAPPQFVPYTLQWSPARNTSPAVGRFVALALNADVPQGWIPERDHGRYGQAGLTRLD